VIEDVKDQFASEFQPRSSLPTGHQPTVILDQSNAQLTHLLCTWNSRSAQGTSVGMTCLRSPVTTGCHHLCIICRLSVLRRADTVTWSEHDFIRDRSVFTQLILFLLSAALQGWRLSIAFDGNTSQIY